MLMSKILRALRFFIRVMLPLLLVAASAWLAYRILSQPQQTRQRPRPKVVARVEAAPLSRRDFRIKVRARGVVGAAMRTAIRAEASGRVVRLHPVFRDGGSFNKGDELIAINPRVAELALRSRELELGARRADLREIEVEVAQMDGQLALARRQQALQQRRLERIKNLIAEGVSADNELEPMELAALTGETNLNTLGNRAALLAARRSSAAAAIELAELQIQSAQVTLDNTRVLAPYAGRVLSRQVELGQYVSPGAELAVIYAVDRAELRLPLSSRQLAYVTLPETGTAAKVSLIVRSGEREHRWPATLRRSEGAIDDATRQLFVIASVERPFELGPDGRPPLFLGSFVRAEIEGALLEDVAVVPRSALRGEDELFLIKDGVLRRQKVSLAWTDADVAVVTGGIDPGDRLCITPLVFAGDRIPVKVVGDPEAAKPEKRGPGKRGAERRGGAGRPAGSGGTR